MTTTARPIAAPTTRTTWHPARIVAFFPPLIWVAVFWLLLMAVVAVFADSIAVYPVDEIHLQDRLMPPLSDGYPLGTDKLGRDVFSRLVYSVQISMLVASIGTVIGGVLGTTLGVVAAHFGGLVDDAIMLLVDFQASLPFIIFALSVLAFFGNTMTLFIIVLGLQGWQVYARMARGMTLSAKEQGYADAVRALGARPPRIYLRHILPNIANVIIVYLTLNFPGTILAEASLSFLGLGVQPPNSSLGLMLSIGRDYLATAWWIAVFPGMTIFITTLAVSLLGDWLRDKLDPTLR